ncbi:AAA family ATPase [Streptomyces sp. NPDC048342]|uniref:ATP-binding protein n=1 Tax=unclassified Streptomyces TaxID=2593676 RepID=UPI0034384EE1
MRLFERDDHEALIRSLVGESLAGRGQVLLLEGVAAGGRTALLGEAVAHAERAGMVTLRAACAPSESEVPGGMLSQLAHSLPVPGAPGEDQVPDVHVFCRWILRTAARSPLMIAVDDLHHADPASVQALSYLARRLGASPVLLVATARRDDSRSPSPFAAELVADPRVRRLDVGPLSAAGTLRFVEERLAAGARAPRIAAGFHRLSGGIPLLLEALAEDWRRGGAADLAGVPGPADGPDPAAAPAPVTAPVTEQGYGAAVADLLRRWDPEVVRIARALAVLGEHGSPDRVAQLAGLDREPGTRQVERALARLTAAGVLRDGRFPHPVAAAVVAGTAGGAERAALHLRAAGLLHALGEPASAVARHLAGSRQQVAQWAVPVLAEAAEHELLAGRYEQAARYGELAHEAGPADAADRAAVLDRLTEAEWRLNPSLAQRRLPAPLTAMRAGQLPGDRLPGLIRRLLWHGRQADAEAALARLREAAAADPALRAESRDLDSWLAFTHPRLARRGPASAPVWAPGGPSAAERGPVALSGGDPWLATAGALAELFVSGRVGDRTDWVEQTLRNLRPHGGGPWAEESAGLALLALLDAGLPDAVLEHCAVLADGDPASAPVWHALLGALRAEALLHRGDLAGALRGAREALTLLPAPAWGVAVGLPLGTLITAAVRSGAFEEGRRQLAFAPPEAMFASRYGLYYLHARGLHHLAAERAYAGLSDFLACGELVQSLGLEIAAPVPWRTSAAEAWLRLGNEDRARRLVRDQLSRSDTADGSGRGRSLRMLAAVSAPERRPQLLLEAVELFEETGDQYAQARTLADLGRAYSALGDSSRARTTLRRARYLAVSCGAVPLGEELLAVPDPAPPAASRATDEPRLTESERRVAHLAVLGYTNREIAAKLYVTSSTVEQHLTRVYRKLDVKRRRDLPADLGSMTLHRRRRRAHPSSVRRSAS